MCHSSILRDFYTTIWEQGRIDELDRFFTEDIRADGWFPGMPVGSADFAVLVLTIRSMVTDIRFTIERTVTQDDWISAYIRVDCFCGRRGVELRITGQLMARFEGNRMAEAYNHMDMITYFVQLGLLPDDITFRMLNGCEAA
ncbi:ester cyclase [Palleronia sp. LCG004]|uniref:ester cyclase n=1 Tax=Palleronia sp. LCG004 TaxID=3079304 RepID=UPI00294365F6|nr:ester cyclase [Palleronia sp. LCG004]WOI55091.1 ester cyclase [Palleronia sp. LCG004]